MKPTSSQVAKLAGVSRTTVSFVLNNVANSGISAETRAKVLNAAAKLSYEPNAAARSLASGISATIGLVLPKIHHLHVDAFLAQVVATVSQEVAKNHFKLLIESAPNQAGALRSLAVSGRIDGLIVVNPRTHDYDELSLINKDIIPIVAFGSRKRSIETGAEFSTTGSENYLSARRLTAHLLALGHRRIAHVAYSTAEYISVNSRERGWRDTLQEQEAYDASLLEYADLSAQSGYEACQRLLSKADFTAIFAGNDTIAVGIIKALQDAGKRIPEDVAIVGYDDIPIAQFLTPALTTTKTCPDEHGRTATHILLQHLRGDLTPIHHTVESKLIIRDSCGFHLASPFSSKS